MKFRVVRPDIAIVSLLFISSCSILPIFCLVIGELWYGVLFLAVWLFAFGGMVVQCVVKKIEIGMEGVQYFTLKKRYEMRWEEVKIIGIGYIPMRAPGKQPWIYFAADGISMPMLNSKMVNDKFFMVSYRKKIEESIRMYWAGNIDGLDSVSEFEKNNYIG